MTEETIREKVDIRNIDEMDEESLTSQGFYGLDVIYDPVNKSVKMDVTARNIPVEAVVTALVSGLAKILSHADNPVRDTSKVMLSLLSRLEEELENKA